jgi:hypothetical protein
MAERVTLYLVDTFDSCAGTAKLDRMAEIIWPKITGVITDTPHELLTAEKRGLASYE